MISTGFSALDNCIGGLKKGKLYTLAGFNFTPPWIVEHFAINMIANSRSYGVVHANYLPQSAGNFFGCKIFSCTNSISAYISSAFLRAMESACSEMSMAVTR